MSSVTKIAFQRAEPDGENLADFWFEFVDEAGPYELILDGWVIGGQGPVQAVEVGAEGILLWSLPLNVRREDLRALHPEIPWSDGAGIRHELSALKLRTEFFLEVGVLLENGDRVGIGSLVGRRDPLPAGPSQFDPVMLTSLGRTGSTWVMTLLGQHPEIVVYRPFDYEPRVTRYWAEVFGVLSEPASHRQVLGAVEEYYPEWWMGKRRELPPVDRRDPELEGWLGGHGVEALARMCRERSDDFYAHVAGTQGKDGARYFAEKWLPGMFSQHILPELYRDPKQVFLVRDFRDMASSIIAFDRKRGFTGFGRSTDVTDAEYVRRLKLDVDSLLSSWRRYQDSAFLLRYEELISDPVPTLRSLLSYLDLEASEILAERMVEEAQDDAARRGRTHPTSATPAASIGRWRQELDAEAQAACEEAFREALDAFGYDEERYGAKAVSS